MKEFLQTHVICRCSRREGSFRPHTGQHRGARKHKKPVNFRGQRQQIRLFFPDDPGDLTTSEGFRLQEPTKPRQAFAFVSSY